MFNPSVEEYVADMAVLLDHILSYEFKTHKMVKSNKLDVPPRPNAEVPQYSPAGSLKDSSIAVSVQPNQDVYP
jgi:hypothetical protein